jgi:hypothetical protein
MFVCVCANLVKVRVCDFVCVYESVRVSAWRSTGHPLCAQKASAKAPVKKASVKKETAVTVKSEHPSRLLHATSPRHTFSPLAHSHLHPQRRQSNMRCRASGRRRPMRYAETQ